MINQKKRVLSIQETIKNGGIHNGKEDLLQSE